MGVYDRDYYREDPPPGDSRFLGGHSACVVLIVLNVAVFLAWLFVDSSPRARVFMADNFTFSGDALLDLRAWTIVTYAFSQKDIWHLLFNMLCLWYFGRLVEEHYGPRNLTWLYLVCAVVSALMFLGINALRGVDHRMLGASGAVMGLTIVAAFLEPNRSVYIWGVLPIKLKWLALLIIILDLAGMANPEGDTIAHSGHLGGALMGFFFYTFDLRLFDRPGKTDLLHRMRSLFRRNPVLRVVPRPVRREESTTTNVKPDSDTAARVDELLAKIHREGMGALSEDEKRFLEMASQKYRK